MSQCPEVIPIYDPDVRRLCTKPYPGHPRGCPNYGKRITCPPQSRLLPELLDWQHRIWLVYNAFDLATHVDKLRRRHPKWSVRQFYCCLYWQGTARKQLRAKVAACLDAHPGTVPLYTPEACGVNVTATMERIGIRLEWPPRKTAYQVALAGYPVETKAAK